MPTTLLELPVAAKYLFGVLNVAAVQAVFSTRIYRGSLAPQGTALPYLLFFQQAASDDYVLPADWQGTDVTYFVKGVAGAAQYLTHLLPGMTAVSAALYAKVRVPTTQDGQSVTLLGSDDPREYEEITSGGAVVVHTGRAWQLAIEPV